MPPTNDFVPFCPTDTGTNLLSQANYLTDPQLPIGNQPGIARLQLVNKALRQATYIAASLAQFLANRTGNNVLDDATMSEVLTTMGLAWPVPFTQTSLTVFHDSGYSWSVTSAAIAYTDPTNNTVGTFGTRQNNGFGTVTTAASNGAGITFTPPSATARYLVMVNAVCWNTQSTDTSSIQLTDGTTVIAKGTNRNSSIVPIPLVGQWTPGTTSPVTLKLQVAENGGHGGITHLDNSGDTLSNSIEWTLVRIA